MDGLTLPLQTTTDAHSSRLRLQPSRSAETTRCPRLLRQAIADDTAVLSGQVLGEFVVTVTRKIPEPMSLDEAREIVEYVGVLACVDIDRGLVKRAIETAAHWQINYWDALIVTAAERSRCRRILSEDLQSGQSYCGVIVENPFLET